MTDKEALKEIDRQEKRFAAAGFGNGLRLAKSAREYYQTIVKCRQKSAEVAAECAAANEKAVAMTAETDQMETDGKTVASFDGNHRAGPGRLFIWRTVALDGWEDGVSRKHVLAIDPVPPADCKGEFRIGSICTATIVPVGLAQDAKESTDDALEKLDHERGK